MDPVAGLTAIFFVCTLVLWAMWSLIYSIFTAHYVLTTLSDSSAGMDEAQFPSESIFDWWWKPILFGWVFLMLFIPVLLLLAPVAFASTEAYLITCTLILWFLYPLALASALYTQNWLHIFHFGVIGRMFHHFPAMIYTYVITFALFAGTLWIVKLALMQSVLWMIPAVVCVPALFLLYARYWGRFAWLSLNHLPRYSVPARIKERPRTEESTGWGEEEEPETKIDAPAEPSDGIREGLPPGTPYAIQAAAPAAPVDDENDLSPYAVIQDPSQPSFDEKPEPPPVAVIAPPKAPPPPVEEEDEWATEKKPYTYVEPDLPPEPAPGTESKTHPNKPITATQYYDDRAKKERKAKRKAEAEKKAMPPLSKKTPTFVAAMITGVWGFLTHNSTLQVWGTMLVLTMIHLFITYMLVMFMPTRG